MGSDDGTIGRVLTRREALALLGAGGLAALGAGRPAAAAAPGACVVRPALTEGPYFVDVKLDRSDIRSDPADGTLRPGAPLRLTLRVSRLAAGACAPLPGAVVDVWHCDAAGVYSDATDPGGSTVGPQVPARLPDHRRRRARGLHAPSIRARTPAARCTSTSRCGPARGAGTRTSSRRSSSSTTRSPTRCTRSRPTRGPRAGCGTGATASTGRRAASSPWRSRPPGGGYAAAFDLALEVG